MRDPARRHQEDADRRREQELADAAFARHMQGLGLDEDHLPDAFGNAAGHHMNANFVRQAHDILAGQYNPAQGQAAQRMVDEHRRHLSPPPPPPPRPPLRQHSTASRQYNNHPARRPSERVVPRRRTAGYEEEAERHRPEPAPVRRATARTASALAGIARGQSGQNRVDEWRQYVDPLDPNLMNGVGI
ncbi:hypothetical protein P7C71_g1811, partial [Lecanoromycetidae sp. Uapishka_2]